MSQLVNYSLVTQAASQLDRFSQFSQLVRASISELDNWTVRSIVFAFTSVTHNNQALL